MLPTIMGSIGNTPNEFCPPATLTNGCGKVGSRRKDVRPGTVARETGWAPMQALLVYGRPFIWLCGGSVLTPAGAQTFASGFASELPSTGQDEAVWHN